MKILYLTLKKKWYDMIDAGEKLDEYREVKDYWIKRLMKHYDAVQFSNGYHKDARKMMFQVRSIGIGNGLTKWGAVDGVKYYVIKLGRRIK